MLYSLILSKKPEFKSEYTGETMVDLLGGSFRNPSSYRCDVLSVPEGFECRPDLISLSAYGDDLDEDIVVKVNCRGNAFELADSSVLVLPEFKELDGFIQTPSTKWAENTLSTYARGSSGSGSKKRGTKQKDLSTGPNAALVSDKRFNIDSLSRVVIY